MFESRLSEEQLQFSQKMSFAEKKLAFSRAAKIETLPAPSTTVLNLMAQMRMEEPDIAKIVRDIEKDQSLAAQVLKLTNSGFYGLRNTVTTVDRAVALLGLQTIKQIIYSAAIMEIFSKDEQAEWHHAYLTSTMMNTLIRENQLPGLDTLPLVMLMHDLGKVVMRKLLPKKYQMAQDQARDFRQPVFMVENEKFQFNHAEIGAFLLERWDTAENITKPVQYHHTEVIPPDYVFETALVQFVNFVDCYARGIASLRPSRNLMGAAGIESIDFEYWIRYQTNAIQEFEKENAAETRKIKRSATTSATSNLHGFA